MVRGGRVTEAQTRAIIFEYAPGTDQVCLGAPVKESDLPVEPVLIAEIPAIQAGDIAKIGPPLQPFQAGVQSLGDAGILFKTEDHEVHPRNDAIGKTGAGYGFRASIID